MRGWFWPGFIVAWLALPIGAYGWLMHEALADTGFAPEPDAYRHAVAWDAHLAELRASAALGWRVDARFDGSRLHLDLRDRDGEAVAAHVEVMVHHVAHRRDVTRTVVLVSEIPLRWRGLHEIRLLASRGSQVFVAVVRRDRSVP